MYIAVVIVLVVVGLMGAVLLTRWGMRWGSTPEERAAQMPGDAFMAGGPRARLVMTRAISINAPPAVVWPWLAQLGRGAGWYSIDRLDNGGTTSARHIVSWIPEPRLGDATAIGYLRHLENGRELAWWLNGERWLGVLLCMGSDVRVTPEGEGSRVVFRMSGGAEGVLAGSVLSFFAIIDSIMARAQLLGIKERAERYGTRSSNPDEPETGAHDQYQLYEIIYATGERAGVPGKEKGQQWRQMAIDDGVIAEQKKNRECDSES